MRQPFKETDKSDIQHILVYLTFSFTKSQSAVGISYSCMIQTANQPLYHLINHTFFHTVTSLVSTFFYSCIEWKITISALCVTVQLMHLFVIKHQFKCHILKTLKITPTCFDHQLIIIRELLILVKITG
jgi:hypothetical protein